MLRIWDRVKETTTTTGTGALALAGAMTAHITFAAVPSMAVNDTCYCCVQAVDGSGVPTGDWEVALYTYSAANQLTHTTFLASSTGSAVSWAAGTKQVMLVNPAVCLPKYYLHPPTTALFNTTYEDASYPGTVSYTEFGYALDKQAQPAGDSVSFRGKSVPAGNYVAIARMKLGSRGGNYVRSGMALSDGTKFYVFGIDSSSTGGNYPNLVVFKYNTTTSYNSTAAVVAGGYSSGDLWLRITDNGTNLLFDYSMDGGTWMNLLTEARTTFLTATKIGVANSNHSATGVSKGGIAYCTYWNDTDFPA